MAGVLSGAALAAAALASAALGSAGAGAGSAAPTETRARQAPGFDGFEAGAKGLTPSARAGREIWFKATAGNGRFFTYVFQQRLGVLVDWSRVLHAQGRGQRFRTWGLINDPDCCVPGSPGCPATRPEQTYGFDWCPGDRELLTFVGRSGYRDPACDFRDAPAGTSPDPRQDPCDLAFGTSTGALGFRKFPNPRFDAARWRALNGSLDSWRGYARALAASGPDARVSRLRDGSIEPPFLIGMACGACHIAFRPDRPPPDPEAPRWAHLDGLVGNQYSRASHILASGMPEASLAWQIFSPARPGTVDTSALPNDQVNNPGTMNPIVNLERRPVFEHVVMKWRPVAACPAGADARACWCEPGKPGKCWERSRRTEPVHHLLKGGEDSIGTLEALQRVYLNIGSCAETCWVNHLIDPWQIDPSQRGYDQSPLDIGQCRRDCAAFRAIEDRLPDLAAFLLTGRPYDLARARGLPNQAALVAQLDREYGAGAVAKGRAIFGDLCAECHSSQPGPFDERTDFRALVPGRPDLRADFLSSDVPLPVTRIGTSRSRALHSNHMTGHVWEEYGSDTLRARPPVPGIEEPSDGGRGYYRPVSLLSVWAFAPFMHNNAIGPEVCGAPPPPAADFYRSPFVTPGTWQRAPDPPACWPYDPSVEGRYRLFKASMEDLLNPDRRRPKITLVDTPIVVDGPMLPGGRAFHLEIPAGIPAALVGNLRYKTLIRDLVLARTNPARLKDLYRPHVGEAQADAIAGALQQMVRQLLDGLSDEGGLPIARIGREHLPFLQRTYSTSTVDVENRGHPFGRSLSPGDKQALIAFLATL